MFKPVPMKHVTLTLLAEDAALVALRVAEQGVFGLEQGEAAPESLPERPGKSFQALYRTVEQQQQKLLSLLRLSPVIVKGIDWTPVRSGELEDMRDRLAGILEECMRCEQGERQLTEDGRNLDQLDQMLHTYEGLEINLGALQGSLRFLDVQIGSLPRSELPRLRQALGMIGYTVTTFAVDDHITHVALAGLSGREAELKDVLEAASFRRLHLPPEFRDTPGRLRQSLGRQRQELEQQRQALQERLQASRQRYAPVLEESAQLLLRAAPFASAADHVHARGALAQLRGWVPADRVARLERALSQHFPGRAVMELRDPRPEERGHIPSLVRHSRLLQPFATLVRSYGLPRYGEFDPTWLFAVSYILMFGMMFGDIGHGLVIALLAWALPPAARRFRPFIVAAGVSSMIFGVLYGSIFGYEHVIHPLWMSPLSDPMRMLTLALAWGVAFIVVAQLILIRNWVSERRWIPMLFDGRGLAGLVLYISGLWSIIQWVSTGGVSALALTVVSAALLTLFVYRWLQTQAPLGERILVVVLETYETVIGYVTNTLSFLRVAAFSLNHVALAIAVFTLAGMMDTAGHWITVVLGNVFIIGLEGAIVAIQVLRLEYYEGFSRFFSGDGHEFKPLALDLAADAPDGSRQRQT